MAELIGTGGLVIPMPASYSVRLGLLWFFAFVSVDPWRLLYIEERLSLQQSSSSFFCNHDGLSSGSLVAAVLRTVGYCVGVVVLCRDALLVLVFGVFTLLRFLGGLAGWMGH